MPPIMSVSDPHVTAVCVLVVFAAGVIRGYGGFGFSMAAVAGMSLMLPPARVVPAVVLLEIIASGVLLPKVWRQVDWRALGWLSIGMLVATPAGALVLSAVPARPMTVAIAMAIIILAVLMRVGVSLKRRPGPASTAGIGVLSGLFNGGGAIGGPPVVLFFFSSPAGAAISRASLIAYFLGTDLIAAGVLSAMGMLTTDGVLLAAVLLAPTAAGVIIGAKAFHGSPEDVFRKRVLLVLIVLSLAALIKAASS